RSDGQAARSGTCSRRSTAPSRYGSRAGCSRRIAPSRGGTTCGCCHRSRGTSAGPARPLTRGCAAATTARRSYSPARWRGRRRSSAVLAQRARPADGASRAAAETITSWPDSWRRSRTRVCRILFDAIEERRAGENARESGSNASVEVTLRVARLLVELHRRRDVLGIHRPAIRAAREVGEDLLRTGRFIRGRSPPADEHLVAGRT